MILMLKVKFSRNSGNLTIETALIISSIILILIGLIFSFMLMYQKALLANAVSKAAQQGAEVWVDIRKQIYTGSINPAIERESIYYRLFDDSLFSRKNISIEVRDLSQFRNYVNKHSISDSIQEQKLNKIIRLIYKELNKGIIKPSNTKMDIEFSNISSRKLEIRLTQTIKLPMGAIKKFFNNAGVINLTSIGTAYISEPAEYIRNIDLALEYVDKFKKVIDYGELRNKLQGVSK